MTAAGAFATEVAASTWEEIQRENDIDLLEKGKEAVEGSQEGEEGEGSMEGSLAGSQFFRMMGISKDDLGKTSHFYIPSFVLSFFLLSSPRLSFLFSKRFHFSLFNFNYCLFNGLIFPESLSHFLIRPQFITPTFLPTLLLRTTFPSTHFHDLSPFTVTGKLPKWILGIAKDVFAATTRVDTVIDDEVASDISPFIY